jgi:hypothetical protein
MANSPIDRCQRRADPSRCTQPANDAAEGRPHQEVRAWTATGSMTSCAPRPLHRPGAASPALWAGSRWPDRWRDSLDLPRSRPRESARKSERKRSGQLAHPIAPARSVDLTGVAARAEHAAARKPARTASVPRAVSRIATGRPVALMAVMEHAAAAMPIRSASKGSAAAPPTVATAAALETSVETGRALPSVAWVVKPAAPAPETRSVRAAIASVCPTAPARSVAATAAVAHAAVALAAVARPTSGAPTVACRSAPRAMPACREHAAVASAAALVKPAHVVKPLARPRAKPAVVTVGTRRVAPVHVRRTPAGSLAGRRIAEAMVRRVAKILSAALLLVETAIRDFATR